MDRCNVRFEILVNFVDGMTTPTESQRIEEHLSGGCSSCRERVALLRQTIDALRDVFASPPPSEASHEFARNLPRLRFPNARETGSGLPYGSTIPLLTRFVAQLVDQQTVAATGFRSANDQASLHRLYETDDHLVSLWEERIPGDEGSYIITQVYSRQEYICLIPEDVLFIAMSSGKTLHATQEANEFHVPRLLPDNYLIQCWLNDRDVLAMHDVRIGDV